MSILDYRHGEYEDPPSWCDFCEEYHNGHVEWTRCARRKKDLQDEADEIAAEEAIEDARELKA